MSNDRVDDLIKRATKYAISAGQTGQGQYMAAHKADRLSRRLSITSTALSAIVGTSIFAQLLQDNPSKVVGVLLGLAAVTAAALSAIERTAKLSDQAEAHRVAGARYGGIRRRADMLRLRIEGGDLSRQAALAELEQLGEALSKTAEEARALPDSIYIPGKKEFHDTHSEYFKDADSRGRSSVSRE